MKYGLNMLYKFAVCLHHGAINDKKSNVPKTIAIESAFRPLTRSQRALGWDKSELKSWIWD